MTARKSRAPEGVTITSYQVGFGDCYLMSFDYGRSKRHVLIDFGTKLRSKVHFKVDMVKIARQIEADCGGKLTMVVATHRHYDHVSGFQTKKNKKGPGDIIRALKPDLVVQPWTEDPKLARDAEAPVRAGGRGKSLAAMHVGTLASMQAMAQSIWTDLGRKLDAPAAGLSAAVAELTYLGGDNITNRSSVENLMTMGRLKPRYLARGDKLDVHALLPGVNIRVLGPPTLAEDPELRHYASSSNEYWKKLAARSDMADIRPGKALGRKPPQVPVPVRWFVGRLNSMNEETALAIVRVLDKTINNTSLILLFEFGGKRLLFPGDAQLENWSAVLDDKKDMDLLTSVDLYKVGHHGSFNATPKSVWNGFAKARGRNKSLQTLLSTHEHEYGHVPDEALHAALEGHSHLLTTEAFAAGEIKRSVTL